MYIDKLMECLCEGHWSSVVIEQSFIGGGSYDAALTQRVQNRKIVKVRPAKPITQLHEILYIYF